MTKRRRQVPISPALRQMPFDELYPEDRPAVPALRGMTDERTTLREAIHDRLLATDPTTADLLEEHPYREQILGRAAAALAESLAEASQEQADPDPPASDLAELYRQIPAERLMETLLVNLVADQGYWRSQMRWTRELLDGPLTPPDQDDETADPPE